MLNGSVYRGFRRSASAPPPAREYFDSFLPDCMIHVNCYIGDGIVNRRMVVTLKRAYDHRTNVVDKEGETLRVCEGDAIRDQSNRRVSNPMSSTCQ